LPLLQHFRDKLLLELISYTLATIFSIIPSTDTTYCSGFAIPNPDKMDLNPLYLSFDITNVEQIRVLMVGFGIAMFRRAKEN
ncbi:MAG: hypothetical protein K2U26_12835, partial [Cyclobacteriaceae bacterium]|nr:hypothetical protein [Cyclobacteriaceae bacterium]